MRHLVGPALALALVLAPHDAAAHEHCRPILAALSSQLTTTSCTSPFGLCTTGEMRGDLRGATSFTVLTLAASAGLGDSEPASTLSYLGHFVLTTREGTLTVSDIGLLDNVTGAFTEIWRVTSGTGEHAGATGNLWLNGTVSATGAFDGTVTGQLCR